MRVTFLSVWYYVGDLGFNKEHSFELKGFLDAKKKKKRRFGNQDYYVCLGYCGRLGMRLLLRMRFVLTDSELLLCSSLVGDYICLY